MDEKVLVFWGRRWFGILNVGGRIIFGYDRVFFFLN